MGPSVCKGSIECWAYKTLLWVLVGLGNFYPAWVITVIKTTSVGNELKRMSLRGLKTLVEGLIVRGQCNSLNLL